MGIATVAVYSDADRKALHVRMADEAVHIGPSPAIESYLVIDKIIAAARETGADAIHPGYGFLSENPAFVRACKKAKITFIGPSAESMEAMGLKDAAKKLMDAAGVPITPGYHGEDQDGKLAILSLLRPWPAAAVKGCVRSKRKKISTPCSPLASAKLNLVLAIKTSSLNAPYRSAGLWRYTWQCRAYV